MDTSLMETTGAVDAARLAQASWPPFPYPGLRPFQISDDRDESLIFYGRNTQKDDILERLNSSQLVAVVGPSGCGKSSLVKVGVIPALKAGLLTRAGYAWQSVQLRPGTDPLGNLAAALASVGGDYDRSGGAPADQVLDVLRSSRSGLWLVMDHLTKPAPKQQRLLLLIDQFEELFTGAQSEDGVDEFVGLITQFFRRPHPNLYVVLTMRADFIADCASFPGLAELLNQTQYIVPVLRGDDLREAITRPAEAYDGRVEPALISALVEDMGAGTSYDADHLPLMQHALLWLWQRTQPDEQDGARDPSERPAAERVLRLDDYRRNGGLQGILERHADDLLGRVPDADGGAGVRIAEVMFRRLSERDARHRYKRAPASVDEVCQLAGCSVGELEAVVAPFRRPEASFIEERPGRRRILDLSHESLIRRWGQLRRWADDEAEKVATFRRYAEEATAWDRHGASRRRDDLRTGARLAVMSEWLENNRPTALWAQRYALIDGEPTSLGDCVTTVARFHEACRSAEDARRRTQLLSIVVVVLAILGMGLGQFQARLREQEAKTRLAVHFAERALDRRSQTLGVNIALELLNPPEEFATIPESETLLTEALQRLRQTHEIHVDGSSRFTSAEYSPDGDWLATVSSGELKLVDLSQAKTYPLALDERVRTARWSPTAWRLLVATQHGGLMLVPIQPPSGEAGAPRVSGAPIAVGTPQSMSQAIFSGDGKVIAVFGMNKPIHLFDAVTGRSKAQIPESEMTGWSPMAISHDGRRIAVQDRRALQKIVVHEPGAPTPLRTIKIKELQSGGPISGLAFDPNDRDRLLVLQGTARVFDLATTPKTQPIRLHADGAPKNDACGRRPRAFQGAFSPDGRRIATSHDDGTICIWSNETGAWIATLREHEGRVSTMDFSQDGRRLVTGGWDQTVRLWNVEEALPAPPTLERNALAQWARGRLPKRIGLGGENPELVAMTPELRCDYLTLCDDLATPAAPASK